MNSCPDFEMSIVNKGRRRISRMKLLSTFISMFAESPVSVKMRIRHYFSHLSINSSASYDVRQGFDKLQFDLIDSDSMYDQRRCQTSTLPPPKKPTRSSLSQQHNIKHSASRSSSVPSVAPNSTMVKKAPFSNV